MQKNKVFKKIFVIFFIIFLITVTVKASQFKIKKDRPSDNYFFNLNEPLTKEDINLIKHYAKTQDWTFTVGETSASKRYITQLCGLEVPKDWQENEVFDPILPLVTLPTKFDWREEVPGGLPPVRDQGACGSCWAFATVGSLECNIKIIDKINADLSEQWLVSCNQETEPRKWGCLGGWWAHDYFLKDGKEDPCGDSGAVQEHNFPYTARDDPCNCPYQHDYFIERCAYVGEKYSVPSVDSIKQAIFNYGPITVGVCAGGYFKIYTGGVYNFESICWPGEVNHAVVLLGWDDNQGEDGVWLLRNSWGDDWGEAGYMKIEYGCSNIGYAARYVEYSEKLTVFCANESNGEEPGSSSEYYGISNARVSLESLDGTVNRTGWTNKNGMCYFYNLPKEKQYSVHATHSSWNQKFIEWKSDDFVIIIMSSKDSRIKSPEIRFFDFFPNLNELLLNIFRLSSFK